MSFSLVLGGLSSLFSFGADRAKAKAQKKMQKYRNKMTNIANGINQNAITQNQTLAIQQSARQAVHMRRDELSTTGATLAASGAAGVRGRSVDLAILNVKREAGLLEGNRTRDLDQAFLQFGQQRLSSSLSAVQNTDISHIPRPSLAGSLLGFAADNSDALGKKLGF